MPDSTYKNYFLGSLTKEAAAEIELRVLDDANFATELASAEENLIEDFLDDVLSPNEAELFRNNYLVTEERIKNVEMTALMKRYARENVNYVKISVPKIHGKFSFFHWFGEISIGIRLVTASLALILLFSGFWFVSRKQADDRFIALQKKYEQINRDQSPFTLDTKISETTLFPGSLRSATEHSKISHSSMSSELRFRIALPAGVDKDSAYDVTLLRENSEVFRYAGITPINGTQATELRLLFPKEIFEVGSYRIVVYGEKLQSVTYSFVIVE